MKSFFVTIFVLCYFSNSIYGKTLNSNTVKRDSILLRTLSKPVLRSDSTKVSPKKNIFTDEYEIFAVLGFSASLLGFVFLGLSLFGFIVGPTALLSLLGLVSSIVGLFQIKTNKKKGKGFARFGIFLAILPYFILAVFVVLFLLNRGGGK
jgi:hypothetical protein